MRYIVLASHGNLADGMKDSAEMIIGMDYYIESLCLHAGHHPDEMKKGIEKKIKQNPKDEFFIICDLFGGSVANALMHLCTYPNVHVVTGMNLGLVISICTGEFGEASKDCIDRSLAEAKRYMLYANTLLIGKEEEYD